MTLNRPEVRNAFNAELIADLHHVATWAEMQSHARVIFLRGAGQTFCAGGDLHWMKDSLNWGKAENHADARRLSAMLMALNFLPIPLVGLIQGGAYGGGVGLVSVCDHVICEKETVFSLSEVRLGLIPACIGPFVVDKVGLGQCRSLFISGERFSAQKAYDIGLVHEVVDGAGALDKAKARLQETFATCGPVAVRTAKHFLNDLKGLSFDEANDLAAQTLADLRVGPEAQEGLSAFLEKRKPKW